MDVVTLTSPSYLPDKPIDGYSSLIWTERFFDHGEFTMVHPDPKYVRDNLPEDTLISLMDTKEVMIVESNQIETNDDGVVTATVSGRTISSILECRTIGAELIAAQSAVRYSTERLNTERIALLIWDAVIHTPVFNNTGYEKSPLDLLPNTSVSVLQRDFSQLFYTTAIIEPGTMWDAIQSALVAGNLGIRSMRPSREPGVYAYAEFLEGNGDFNPDGAGDYPDSLMFQIYQGQNRTNEPQQTRYDVGQGNVLDPNYLFSTKAFKNAAYVIAPWSRGYWAYPLGYILGPDSGFKRRTMLIDGRSWDDLAAATADNVFAIQDRARQLLLQNNQRLFFDGKISSEMKDLFFGTNIGNLGDIIVLSGEYGIEIPMQVIEKVRTQDESGETNYPTVALPATT